MRSLPHHAALCLLFAGALLLGACTGSRLTPGSDQWLENTLAPIDPDRPSLIVVWGEHPAHYVGTLGALLFAAYDDGQVIFRAPLGENSDSSAYRYLTYRDNALVYRLAHNTDLRGVASQNRRASPLAAGAFDGTHERFCIPTGSGLRCFWLNNPDRQHIGQPASDVCRQSDQEERQRCYYLNGVYTAVPGNIATLYRSVNERIEQHASEAVKWTPPSVTIVVRAAQCEEANPSPWPRELPRPSTGIPVSRQYSYAGVTEYRRLELTHAEVVALETASSGQRHYWVNSACFTDGDETWRVFEAWFQLPNAQYEWMWTW